MMKMLYLLLIVWGAYTAEASTCKTVWEDKCMDVPGEECTTVRKPYPVTRSEEECNTVYDNQCSTVFDTEVDVVDRQECQTVKVPKHVSMPVKICDEMPEQKCETKYAEECHTEYEKECSTNYEVVCGDTLHEEVCDTSLEYKTDIKKEKKCHLETETQCHETPFTDCQTVRKPVTKYRDEEECRTVYDQVCVPSYEESCHTVTERQCKTVTETECDHNNRCWDEERDECWDEPRQECKQTPKKVCNNVPRQKCTTVQHPYTDYEDKQECSTTNKPVCRQVPVNKCYDVETPVNHLVPGSKCQNQKVCKKVLKQDCKDVPRQKCISVPKQECHTVQSRACHTEYNEVTTYEDKEECKTVQDKVHRKVARQVCNKVPRKECRQVPVTETVFKDETECYTVNERKCTKVSTKSCSGPPVLFFQVNDPSVTELPCCQGKNVQSCQKIYLDAAVLGKSEVEITPLQQTVKHLGKYGGGDNTYHYRNDKIEMNMFYDLEDEIIYGRISDYSTGDHYLINSCSGNINVLKKIARGKSRRRLESSPKKKSKSGTSDAEQKSSENGAETESCIKPCATEDEIVTYSVNVYYTPAVEKSVKDKYAASMKTYIGYLITETNLGYMNSEVPIRVKLNLYKPLPYDPYENGEKDDDDVLDEFVGRGLRGRADAAVLLIEELKDYPKDDVTYEGKGICGVAKDNVICSGETYSVSEISCFDEWLDEPNFVFGHELGHNIGLGHNIEVERNENYEHGHGFWPGKEYRTIMAYDNDDETLPEINYYSNPDVPYINEDGTEYKTGVKGESNNARILRENRCAMANVGPD